MSGCLLRHGAQGMKPVFPRTLIEQEEPDPLNGERAFDSIRDLGQHGFLVRFGAEFTSELDHGEAGVVAVAVKHPPIELFLDPSPDWLKDERGERDKNDKRRRRDARGTKDQEDQGVK